MKVKELIELLQGQNPELPVILQKDPEGNGYYGVYGVEYTLTDSDGDRVSNIDRAVGEAVVIFP